MTRKDLIKQLRGELSETIQQAGELLDAAELEKRKLNEEEESRYQELLEKAKELRARIERLQEQQDLEDQAGDPAPVLQPDDRLSGRAPAVHTREDRSYSLWRAIKASASGDWSDAKVEARLSDELRELTGREPQRSHGFLVDHRALLPREKLLDIEKRIVEKGGTASGAGLVATDLLVEDFIELLRNATVVGTLGTRFLPGLVGDVDIPRQSAGASAGWLATETTAAAQSNLTIDTVALTPKTVGVYSDITRRMQKQSAIAIEELVRQDLRQAIGLAVDLAAINGSGTGGQPTGILNTSGIGNVDMSTLGGFPGNAWSKVVEFESDLGAANALRGSLWFLTNASVQALMKTTVKASGTAMYVQENGEMNGYRVAVSEQVPANTLIFGNFQELLIGMWGVLDMFADPYTNAASGQLRVLAFQDVDVAVRHAASFSASSNVNQ